MGIVMLMLAMILGVVIHFTGENMEMQSISMMRTIAAAPFQHGNLGKPPEEVRLPFFTVQIGNRGELLGVSGGYFDLTDREYIQNIVDAALSSDERTEELEEYQLSPRMETRNQLLRYACPAATFRCCDAARRKCRGRKILYP